VCGSLQPWSALGTGSPPTAGLGAWLIPGRPGRPLSGPPPPGTVCSGRMHSDLTDTGTRGDRTPTPTLDALESNTDGRCAPSVP
jgi:hypothetical protein